MLLGGSPRDVAQMEAKYRAQQQYAINQHTVGLERQLRCQVLSLVHRDTHPEDVVPAAEKLWAFVTAGDPTPVESDGGTKI